MLARGSLEWIVFLHQNNWEILRLFEAAAGLADGLQQTRCFG